MIKYQSEALKVIHQDVEGLHRLGIISDNKEENMEEFKVLIPDEKFEIIEYKAENLPAVMVVNKSLINFEPKEIFSWNLSIIIKFNELNNNGMPKKEEVDLIIPFEERIDDKIKGDNKNKPNSLFLARITWNATREIIYRVYEPKIVNDYLQDIINKKNYPREFDYRMEHDEKWELNKWFLSLVPSLLLC